MEWLSAVLGLVGAVIGAVIAGIVEYVIMKKSLDNDKLKFQLEIKEKVISTSESQEFYTSSQKEILVYDRLLNEIHYLNNITHPKKKYNEGGFYPHIENNIASIIGDVELPPNLATLLGALRCNIEIYSSFREQNADITILETALKNIHALLEPINDERFENYMQIRQAMREYNQKENERKIADLRDIKK